jgi:transcriptional regulator with PAS, ATPase and Fis domain
MTTMRIIAWEGDPPPRTLATALRGSDIAVQTPRRGTSRGAAPEAPSPAPGDRLSERAASRASGADRLDAATRSAGADAATRPLPLVVFTARARRVPAMAVRGRADRPWIWLTSQWPGEERCREAVLAGAYDVISLERRDAAAQLVARIEELLVSDPTPPDADGLVTASEASRRVLAQVARVAPTSMPVLLTGETGTGKEVLARLIHAWSPRHAKQFVPINCAAIPNELMEAELFGYARGAFSGAVQGYDGQLMAAAGGTVFMDEIDDTPLATQVKLLRVLEDRIVSRLGENVWHQVDFRILAATNRDLEPLIRQGAFGSDLYERLAIVRIHLVPLRERLDDLPALARHFLMRFAREQPQTGAARVKDIRADALRALQAYAWPGNIRELRNVIYETLVYKRAGEEIILADLPKRVLTPTPTRDTTREPTDTDAPLVDAQAVADRIARGQFNLRDEVAGLQRAALEEALRRAGGNATKAARLLGSVGRGRASDPGGTVRAMARRLGIDD